MRYNLVVKNKQFPALWIMVAITLPIIGVLAWNQFRWLQNLQEREEQQIEHKMYSSVQSLSRALIDELMFLPALLRIPHESGQNMKTVFSERYQFWSLCAIDPGLVKDISLINATERKTYSWSKPKGRFFETSDPALIELSTDTFADGIPVHWFRTPEKGVVLFFPFWEEKGKRFLISCSIDPDVVQETLIPELAANILEERERYAYRIINRNTGFILFDVPEGLDNSIFAQPALDVPLSGPIPNPQQIQNYSFMTRRLSKISPDYSTFSEQSILDSLRPRTGAIPALFSAIRIQAAYYKDSPYQVSRKTTLQNSAISFGILILLVFVIVTLAETTRKSKALALSQQNFIASVTHELKTPLSVISSASQNLSDGIVRDTGKSTQYGAVIHKEAMRLTTAIDHFIFYANTGRLSPSAFGPCDVVEILSTALSYVKDELSQSGFQTELDMPQEPVLVRGDRVALLSVMKNLMQNAIRHAQSGLFMGAAVSRTTRRGKPYVAISIRDKGPGIPPREQKRVFEPFERGKRAIEDQVHGNGVGLNLARRIVVLHRGYIVLESKPGAGCVFTVLLPEYRNDVQQAVTVGDFKRSDA